MNSLERAYAESEALADLARSSAVKNTGGLIPAGGDTLGGIGNFREEGANRRRYSQFRGWVYAAINALASEAAGQSFHMGRILGAEANPEQRSRLTSTKSRKAHEEELEIIPSHELIDAIENPNPIQHRWQFVYSFVANLNLTGWSYVIGGENPESGRLEFYSVPTTWVRPDHKEGPFSRFKIVNPKNPQRGNDDDWLTREQVAFAHLPNPSDPLSALAPAASQAMAVSIDDNIQTSQNQFFDNGIFPSVLITIGRDPHPDIPSGIRPRLTAMQRRQVHGAIKKITGGIANYGNPAIIDGLIEKIERLSATQNEMGWDKSEDKVVTRILSAFAVHRFILGDTINVGGYAQAYKIEERFCKRVNTFLDMLSSVMTTFAGPMVEQESRTVVWWEKCEPHDPDQERRWWETGRKSGDVKRNEFRAKLGLPPIEEEEESRNALLESVGGMTGAINLFNALGQGTINADQVAQLLVLFFQISEEQATSIVGNPEEQEGVEEAIGALGEVVEEIRKPTVISLEGSEGIVGRIATSVVQAARSTGTDRELDEITRSLDELKSSLSTEKANRELGIQRLALESNNQISRVPGLVQQAFSRLEDLIRSRENNREVTTEVKQAVGDVGNVKGKEQMSY